MSMAYYVPGDVLFAEKINQYLVILGRPEPRPNDEPHYVGVVFFVNHISGRPFRAGTERFPDLEAGTVNPNGNYRLFAIEAKVLPGFYRNSVGDRLHALVEVPDVDGWGRVNYIAGCRTFASYAEAMEHWKEPLKFTYRKEKRALAKRLYTQAVKLGWFDKSVLKWPAVKLAKPGQRPVASRKKDRKAARPKAKLLRRR
jgi:hypothetical protein